MWRPRGGRSRLTYRLLGLLIDGLPAESLTKTAMRNEYDDRELQQIASERSEHPPFSHTDLLIAHLIDVVAAIGHGLGGSNGDPPKYPRPGIAPAGGGRVGKMTRAQMDAYEERIKRGG